MTSSFLRLINSCRILFSLNENPTILYVLIFSFSFTIQFIFISGIKSTMNSGLTPFGSYNVKIKYMTND